MDGWGARPLRWLSVLVLHEKLLFLVTYQHCWTELQQGLLWSRPFLLQSTTFFQATCALVLTRDRSFLPWVRRRVPGYRSLPFFPWWGFSADVEINWSVREAASYCFLLWNKTSNFRSAAEWNPCWLTWSRVSVSLEGWLQQMVIYQDSRWNLEQI